MSWRPTRELLKQPRSLIAIGLVIRELLSFWTGHPYDLEVWLRTAFAVAQGQNPYAAFLPPVPGLSIAYLNQTLGGVGYLPVWPVIVAALYKIYAVLPFSPFFLYFLLKQPCVLADVYVGVLIRRIIRSWGGSSDTGLRALRYWTFFPYAILISAVWGQFDSLVAVLILMTLLSSAASRRVVLLGSGIALKWFPVIFLPFFALRDRWPKNVASFLSLAIPAGLTLLIFQVMGWDYLGVTGMATFQVHGGGNGMSYVTILGDPVLVALLGGMTYVYAIFGYLWIPAVVIGAFIAHRRFASDPQGTVQAMLLITTLFFLTRWGVYEQYLMYLFPLFLVDIALWHPERRPLFRLLFLEATAYLLVNNDLLVRFLGPVSPSFVDVAYAADNASILALPRVVAIYVLSVIITITFVQMALVFANPSRPARPWPWAIAERLRGRTLRQPVESESDP